MYPMSSQPNGAWLTQDAYDRLAKELAELEGPGRTEIAERIAAARDEGDLKENGGYHAARAVCEAAHHTTWWSEPPLVTRAREAGMLPEPVAMA